MTTKAGLAKNLYCKILISVLFIFFTENTTPGFNVDSFFPRCYDLGEAKQIDEFLIDY